MTVLLLSFRTAGDFCIRVDTCETRPLNISPNVISYFKWRILKKDTKSFVRYPTPEKYCEYGVHQVGLCLSHPPRGRGGEGWEASQSRVELCTTPGGGRYSTKFYTGRLRPNGEVQPLTLLYTIFDLKRSPFVYF